MSQPEAGGAQTFTFPGPAGPGGLMDPRQLLGDFRTALWFPQYRLADCGSWTMRVVFTPVARGYWGERYRVMGTVVLEGLGADGERVCWMSTTPWEIESQEVGLIAARGRTVVLGLGMGWQAANAALRPDVTHVTVVERDPSIIALVRAQGVFEQLPQEARDKIAVVQADADHWRPAEPVDTLLADIWEKTDAVHRLADVRRMQDNIRPSALYFWGQEMHIWRAAQKRGVPLDAALLRAIVAEDFALPLIAPDGPDYPEKIAAAAKWWTPKDLA